MSNLQIQSAINILAEYRNQCLCHEDADYRLISKSTQDIVEAFSNQAVPHFDSEEGLKMIKLIALEVLEKCRYEIEMEDVLE
ncbi:hypothetical protein HDU76_003533, partial [Blyttiomyces sp. JEL0837]